MNSHSRKGEEEKNPSFSLTSTNSLFSSRSNDIFAGLEALEQKHAAYQEKQETSDSLERVGVIKHDPVDDLEDRDKRDRRHSHSRSIRGRDSHSYPHRDRDNSDGDRIRHRSPIAWNSDQRRERNLPGDNFRRPRHFAPKSKRAPDFKIHPEKWTSYSLEDVSERDLSEKSNTRAALDFLWERKNERERQKRLDAGLPADEEKFESDTAACSKGMISFSRKKQKEKNADVDKRSHGHRNMLGTTFDDQDNHHDVSSNTHHGSIISNPLLGTNKHELDTEVKVSTLSDSKDSCGNEGRQQTPTSEPAPTFKSRKNVRKQFRKRNDDDVDFDSD